MSQFVWDESFNIGVDEIDKQHRVLLDLLNECVDTLPRNPLEGQAVLERLKEYADTHFRDEEALMQSVGYPDIEQHREQHRLFDGHVRQLEREVATGRRNSIASIVDFLMSWYLRHIQAEDRRIATFMLSTGSAWLLRRSP